MEEGGIRTYGTPGSPLEVRHLLGTLVLSMYYVDPRVSLVRRYLIKVAPLVKVAALP